MTHPAHDCEDCGVLHFSWSSHEKARLDDEAERSAHGDVAEYRFTRLYGVSPEGVPLYVEVPEPDEP